MSIFGQQSVAVNLATGKPLDNSVQRLPHDAPPLLLCTTPDREDQPGLPVNIFRNGEFLRVHTVEDPRFLFCQRFEGLNRRNGYQAEIPTADDTDLDERFEPLLMGDNFREVPSSQWLEALKAMAPVVENLPHRETVTATEVFEHFAPVVGARCCIAGGAIRDELVGRTPRDIDVFCFGPFKRAAILAAGAEVVKDESQTYVGTGLSQVLTVNWRGAELQFVWKADGPRDVDSLLDSFDWRICLFAFDGASIIRRMDPATIGGKQLLRLNHTGAAIRTAVRTLRRGYMFAERYDMQIHDGDLAALCAEVLHGYQETHAEFTTAEIIRG